MLAKNLIVSECMCVCKYSTHTYASLSALQILQLTVRERERDRGRRFKVCNRIYLCPQQDVAFDLHLRKRSLCGGVCVCLCLCYCMCSFSCQRVCLHWNLSTWITDMRVSAGSALRLLKLLPQTTMFPLRCPALPPSLITAPLRRRRLSTKILIAATLCVRVAQCWKLV